MLLYCLSVYPASHELETAHTIDMVRSRIGIYVGYSYTHTAWDHTPDLKEADSCIGTLDSFFFDKVPRVWKGDHEEDFSLHPHLFKH